MDDHELLREYLRGRSQDAFRQLVERHLPMVLSAARRITADSQLAEEVAQRAFTTLAQKAQTLGTACVVGGWLYNTTRHLAMHAVRTEQRRCQREQAAVAMQSHETSSEVDRILDQLEPAMADLQAAERDALVLRYLEDRSLGEVGRELGISEDAARMRVNRALERLRTVLANKGVTATAVLLATTLAASTTTAVPVGLVATIAVASVSASVYAATATPSIMSALFNLKAVATILGAILVAGTGTYLVQQREIDRLRTENQILLAQESEMLAQKETVAKAAQASKDDLERAQRNNTELLRLRNEVGQLRRDLDERKQQGSQIAPPTSKEALQAAHNPGSYIAKDQLAFVGYATPEAALESMTWAMMKGSYEQTTAGLAPDLAKEETQQAGSREQFENGRKIMAPLFQGMQIVARKTLGDDKVELKVRFDTTGPQTDEDGDPLPRFMIQPMVKTGNEWKLGGSTRGYDSKWDGEGQIQSLGQ